MTPRNQLRQWACHGRPKNLMPQPSHSNPQMDGALGYHAAHPGARRRPPAFPLDKIWITPTSFGMVPTVLRCVSGRQWTRRALRPLSPSSTFPGIGPSLFRCTPCRGCFQLRRMLTSPHVGALVGLLRDGTLPAPRRQTATPPEGTSTTLIEGLRTPSAEAGALSIVTHEATGPTACARCCSTPDAGSQRRRRPLIQSPSCSVRGMASSPLSRAS